MKSAIKDANGNSLRPRYRVVSTREGTAGQEGTIIGLSPPWSVTVEWDSGEEEVVNARLVRHLSKLG